VASTTTRLALPYPVASDPNNVPADMQRLADAIDAVAVVKAEGLFSARPAPAINGRIFRATDTGAVYFDTGAAWIQLNVNLAASAQAKGDLLAGSAPGAIDRLPVGTNGQQLTADSSQTLGMKWANIQGLPLGLTGAAASSRYVGATASGSPSSGTFVTGDYVIAQDGVTWVCTAGGNPGTWAPSYSPALGKPVGLSGAAAGTRYVGGTTSGAPTSGTYQVGDTVVAQNGAVWICTAGGTPGTWKLAVGRLPGPYQPSVFTPGGPATLVNAASVVVPDPGYTWWPLVFGSLEVRSHALGTRPGAIVYTNNDPQIANTVAHGSGIDPNNYGLGTPGPWFQAACVPYLPTPASPIPAGASTAARTFKIAALNDFGGGDVSCTTFWASLAVWIIPWSS
jgi:hypothetical protein